jgi:hypothetical protein
MLSVASRVSELPKFVSQGQEVGFTASFPSLIRQFTSQESGHRGMKVS